MCTLHVQENERGVIALKRIMNCGIKVSLNYTILLKNKTLHKLSISLKHVCHMGCAYTGKEADLTFNGNRWESEFFRRDS